MTVVLAQQLPDPGYGVLAALVAVIAVSVWLGELAQRAVDRGSFLRGYFLGNRSLGVWALALTVTVQSGGTFMGFPSLVYSHGWVVALWIGSYMVVPITGFAILGKRLAQLSRRTGALTAPDLLRARYDSPAVGLTASLLIMAFMTFMTVAQFKAGALVMKIAWPGSGALALSDDSAAGGIDRAYYVGLAVFAVTVVGYTLIGGFLASVWTDLFQSVLMVIGVVLLVCLALPAAGGLSQATATAIANTSPRFALPPGHNQPEAIAVDAASAESTAAPRTLVRDFLPFSLACSMFVHWVFTGVGSPPSVVRLMASDSSANIRRSIFVLSVYNMCIYLPIIAIAVCGQALIPGLDKAVPSKSDEIIPRLALHVTDGIWGGRLLAGLILAAPFGAVMATVSTYLVVISSGLVRDVYQRFLRPAATEHQLRRVTYGVMLAVGAVAVAASIRPVPYLQMIVVVSTAGAASGLLVPALMAAYWRRATAAGALASMLVGAGTVATLTVCGSFSDIDQGIGGKGLRPYYLAGLEPVVWGFLASAVAGIVVSLRTQPPRAEVVAKMFNQSYSSRSAR